MWILILIVIGTVVALLAPDKVLLMKYALQPSFAVTMFFVGMLVQRDQVRAFLNAPLRPLVGLAAQYTIMPLAAAAVALFFDDPLVRTGIVLVGCMPGAMASNVMTVLLKGDVILSVTMTALATLVCPLVIAFWLPLLADTRMALDVWPMIGNALWMVVLPVVAGALVRMKKASVPHWFDTTASVVASLAITLIVLVVVAANRERLLALSPGLGTAMLVLNLAGYGLAYVVGTLLKWLPAQRRTLMIEVGMQNAGLGSVLALTHLGEAGAVPSALYTAVCVLTAAAGSAILTFRTSRRSAR